jgi:hypothetical protein
MTYGTTLPQCFVLIDKWAALLRVAFEAGLVFAKERKPAGFERLLNVCWGTFDSDPLVRIVTIGAAHFALGYRMMVRQLERRADFQVTLETGFRRFSWIDNRASPTPGFDVQTPGPVAGLTTHVSGFLWSFAALCAGLTHDDLFCLQSRVGSCSEVAHDLFVTGGAFL